jgi:hypothetical protein
VKISSKNRQKNFFFQKSTKIDPQNIKNQRPLNGYFPVTYLSTKYQQVIHKRLKWGKNAVFDFSHSFFSFVHLMLT